MSALTAQKAFLNNFKNVINRRVDVREEIKSYQETSSYESCEVDYSMGEKVYMLPRDMNLSIMSGTVGYNSKILVSNGKFNLEKNDKVDTFEMVKISHNAMVQPTITHKNLRTRAN